MNDLTNFVEGLVNQLGRTFFFAGFMPVLIGVAINQYVFFAPPYAGAEAVVWNLFPAVTSPWLGLFSGEMLTTIVISLALALALIPLNLFVIRLFEGMAPGMKAILFPLYLRRKQQHSQLYGEIAAKRAERQALLQQAEESGERDYDAQYVLEEALDGLHSQKEKKEPGQSLPYDRNRLAPTLYGNAWAVMEEYPLTRYGMDSLVFWPYVRVAITKENPDLLGQIDSQKLLVDMTTHLALVMGILLLEGLVIGVVRFQWQMLLLALVCLGLFLAFYQAGVNYVRTMATSVCQSFDLYRLKVLDDFGLARPVDLDDEFWVWTRLAAFLRRGEPFYFDMLARASDEEEDEDKS